MFNHQTKAILKSALLFKQQKKSLPQTLIFFVTSRCNARCTFCLYYDQITHPVKVQEELTISEIELIAKNYGKLHYLALSGGEPFIRKDIGDLCQIFIDHCKTAVIDIPSNFYYTDSMLTAMTTLVKKNPNVIFDLQISIDQIGKKHDESRKVKNLYETALKTFSELAMVRKHHPNLKLKVNVVYLEKNRNDLHIIKSALKEKIDSNRIQLTYPHELLPPNFQFTAQHQDKLEHYIQIAEEFMEDPQKNTSMDFYTLAMRSVKKTYHRILKEALTNKRNLGQLCEAGRYIVVINEKGDVFPCEPLWKPIGNLRSYNYNLKNILNSSEYKDFREKYLGPGKCNCTWSCAALSSISVQPRFLPEIALNSFQILLKDFKK